MRPGPNFPDRRFSDLMGVIEATRRLTSARDLPQAMALFARELTILFDASACLISTYEQRSDHVTDWAAFVIPPAQLNIEAEDYALNDYPMTRRVLRELIEVSTVVGDDADSAEQTFLEHAGFRSSLLVPLVIGGSAAGLIEVLDTRRRTFTDAEHRYCRLLADNAGIALGASEHASELDRQHVATVAALAAALEAKDAYTGGHAHVIAEFAVAVGEHLGMSGAELRPVQMAALLHDVGKIGIPEAILNKPGPLTVDEFDVMKRHTVIGADIIASIPGLDEVVGLVRSSHERWDGRGYPDGLAGLQVPRGSYVIAVCDAYHAMTEDRVYRVGMSAELALQELRRCSGTQFMPAAVEALEHVVAKRPRRVRFTEAA